MLSRSKIHVPTWEKPDPDVGPAPVGGEIGMGSAGAVIGSPDIDRSVFEDETSHGLSRTGPHTAS